MTEIYGPEEQVLVLSEQLHNRRQSPFADSEMGVASDQKICSQYSESTRPSGKTELFEPKSGSMMESGKSFPKATPVLVFEEEPDPFHKQMAYLFRSENS